MRPERLAQPDRETVDGHATDFISFDGIGYRDGYLPVEIPHQIDAVNPVRDGIETGYRVNDALLDVIEWNKAAIHRSPSCFAFCTMFTIVRAAVWCGATLFPVNGLRCA